MQPPMQPSSRSKLRGKQPPAFRLGDAPRAWCHLLVIEYLDAASRCALFQVSRECSEMVMSSAKHAELSVAAQAATAKVAKRFQAAVKLLHPRHCQPTTLVIQQGAHTHLCDLHHLLLCPAGRHVTKLELSMQPPEPADAAAFLQTASATMPHLRTLHLDHLVVPLPSRLFPHLTDLQVGLSRSQATAEQEAVCRSLAAYWPQLRVFGLTLLEYQRGAHVYEVQLGDLIPWACFDSSEAASSTLRQVQTSSPLDDALLSVAMQRAPNLHKLQVSDVKVRTRRWAGAEWSLRVLSVTNCACRVVVKNLPRRHPTAPPPVIRCAIVDPHPLVDNLLEFEVFEQGVSETELATHLQYTWQGWDTLLLYTHLDADAQPQALARALQQVAPMLRSGELSLCLSYQWGLSQALLRRLAAALVQLQSVGLRLELGCGDLGDATLATLLRCPLPVQRTYVSDMLLLSDAWAGVPWPWERLTIYGLCRVRQLVMLPDPGSVPRTVRLDGGVVIISLTLAEVRKPGYIPQLAARLSHLALHTPQLGVVLEAIQGGHTAPVLRACIQLLKALNTKGCGKVEFISLSGWCLSLVAAELLQLPRWDGCQLRVAASCYWEHRADCGVFGRLLPACYRRVWLKGPYSVESAVAVCRGLAGRVQTEFELGVREGHPVKDQGGGPGSRTGVKGPVVVMLSQTEHHLRRGTVGKVQQHVQQLGMAGKVKVVGVAL